MDFPICLVKNADGELHVVPGAIKYLMGLKQQVVVVAVVGLYRTGKSYIMNKLSGKRNGFALGATIQSKTKGIWIWCVPHPEKRDHTLVLLDTEGMGEGQRSKFSMLLLSITLVYNSRGTIDNQAVENLQYVSELTERIKVNSSSAALSSHFFPNFVWAVRDFTLLLEIDGRNVTEDEYLEHSLELRKDTPLNLMYNLPRECIRNYFHSRKCFVFPTPTTPANMPHLDSMDEADLCGSFRKVEIHTNCQRGPHIYRDKSNISKYSLKTEVYKLSLESLKLIFQPLHKFLYYSDKITEGIYELYCNHHENMLAQYRAKPDKGVGAEEILEQFRKEKSLEKYSILQADKKTDQKFEKEKEGSAVLEQEKKAAGEKRLEMEDDRRSKDEKLQQMEEKMKEEMKQQKRDFHRALGCKMQEQKDLLEKGHKEKADLMRQEIEEFKNSNKPEKEGCGFLESTVMPVLRFGLDAANTFFQYTLMKVAFMK
uniref:GB1/RHD3-type G domain-containing protein n=1 Tax=Oncorhynchus mykiss TaxID=8022 RepID=A0A8K9UDZ7_ONCMY